jgi:hypothetical protein
MKKIILFTVSIFFGAVINAQTAAGRKAGGKQQEFIPVPAPSKVVKTVEKAKEIKTKKPQIKTTSGSKATILKPGNQPDVAFVTISRQFCEFMKA